MLLILYTTRLFLSQGDLDFKFLSLKLLKIYVARNDTSFMA